MRFATIRDISRNPKDVFKGNEPIVLTKNGKPLKLIVNYDEDMMLLNTPKVQASIAKSRAAIARGDRGMTTQEYLASRKKRNR